MKTLDLKEAADFLKISYTTASRMSSSGALPGSKIGSSWVFLEDELVQWLRAQTIEQQRERQALAHVESQLSGARQTPKGTTRRREPVPLPELPG